jgi:predicted permease
MSWFNRFSNLFHRENVDEELDEELQFHLDARTRDNFNAGMNPEAAQLDARRRFGNATLAKERAHEMNMVISIETIGRDLRYALRSLRKSPGFTMVALLTLALGVGANTAVFSLINGLLLRPLPVPHAEQLAVLRLVEGDSDPNDYVFCAPFFRGLENRHEVFSDVFAYNGDTLQVKGQSGNENVPGMLVSGQFFQAMETAPLLGRYLTPEDDQPGGSSAGLAVVISEDFWNNRFNRAPDVVGRTMIIANTPFTVVGVMPKRFIGADVTQRPEIYAPLSADPIIDAPRNHIDDGIHAWWLIVGARLKPGIGMEQANAALLTVSNPILHEAGAADASFIAEKEKGHFHFVAEPGSKGYTYARFLFRKPLVAMFAMCGGILLLACLNLASLLMARGMARQRELATRLAMGATRRRVVQQLLTESLTIAVLGTAAGLTAAPLVSHSLAALAENGWTEMRLDTSLDLSVFFFAALIALVSSILIGLVPALQATAGNLNDHIKEGQQARPALERRRILPRALMATEVAVALTLVIGAGLLATSLWRLFKSGAGFDPKGLVNIAFKMDKQQLEGDALMRLYQQLGTGLSHQPGVKSVSFEFIVPLSHRGWNATYSVPGEDKLLINMNAVAPDYFTTMRIPLYQGREFRWNDTNASGLKIILNESAANLFFPGQNAVGRQIVNPRKMSYEIVAVVADSKYRDLRAAAVPIGYVPIQQDEQAKPSLTAVVRTEGPHGSLATAARALAARLAPTIPAPVVTDMNDVMRKSVSTERMMALLSVFFAGCALLVTAIGLYGTLAYATSRRTSEIGIRMALGARRAGVVAMVFRENVLIAAVGTGAGLIAAILASRALASFLYETSPRDPSVLVCSVAALAFIASAASVLPALRAARIDPMRALRNE